MKLLGGMMVQDQRIRAVDAAHERGRPEDPGGQDDGSLDEVPERLLKVGGQRGVSAVSLMQEAESGRQAGSAAGGDRMVMQHGVADVEHDVHRIVGIGRDPLVEREALTQE